MEQRAAAVLHILTSYRRNVRSGIWDLIAVTATTAAAQPVHDVGGYASESVDRSAWPTTRCFEVPANGCVIRTGCCTSTAGRWLRQRVAGIEAHQAQRVSIWCAISICCAHSIKLCVCVSNRVKSWADKLGVELWHLGDFITRRKEVQDVSPANRMYSGGTVNKSLFLV